MAAWRLLSMRVRIGLRALASGRHPRDALFMYHVRMDYPQWYNSVSRPFRTARRARALEMLDKGLVFALAAAYIGALAWLAFQGDARVARAIAVPATVFFAVSAIRVAVNRKRPYEAHAIEPLIVKETNGKSFPSRHVASAVVIACTLFWLNPVAGTAALLAASAVCFTRIVGGVHYPSDVIAAALAAAGVAVVGFAVV